MNEYSIRGSGTESGTVGIIVEDKGTVTIEGPGAISNFQAGILASESDMLKISSTILENNQVGVSVTGADNAEIQQNIFQSNDIGVASHSSSAAAIDGNLMSGNLLAGITFVNTQLSNVGMNNIMGSQNGIFLDGQSSNNTVEANNVLQNVIDINNANGSAPSENDNKYLANNCLKSMPSEICMGSITLP